MIVALTIAAVALFIVLVLMWAMQHCLACDPDADPMEATSGVVHPGAPELDAAIKRRVLIGCGFVLAMICLSAWVGAR